MFQHFYHLVSEAEKYFLYSVFPSNLACVTCVQCFFWFLLATCYAGYTRRVFFLFNLAGVSLCAHALRKLVERDLLIEYDAGNHVVVLCNFARDQAVGGVLC